jgi:hypothetical protein
MHVSGFFFAHNYTAMHVLEVISVLEYTGYLPVNIASGYLSDFTVPPQFGPTEPYVPIYTEFEYYARKDQYGRNSINPLVNPPTGLSSLALSLWLVNRDIGVVKLRLAANPASKRVFRYNSDAQTSATSVAEVVQKHSRYLMAVYECDGFHHELKTKCKCRSPNAVPATDVDPIGLQLETLEATAKSYADAMPFKVRLAALDETATAAELKAGDTEEAYRHSLGQGSIMNYKKDPPHMSFKWSYSTETPTYQQKAANEQWAKLGKAASEARAEAQAARAAVLDYIADMETQALSRIGAESAATLRIIRENNRNGLPKHSSYGAAYAQAVRGLVHTTVA